VERVVTGEWPDLPECRACGGFWWQDAWAVASVARWHESSVADLYVLTTAD
jgi:hypothetical protein